MYYTRTYTQTGNAAEMREGAADEFFFATGQNETARAFVRLSIEATPSGQMDALDE